MHRIPQKSLEIKIKLRWLCGTQYTFLCSKKVQVGKDQEKSVNQKKIPTPKPEVGKKQTNNQVLYTMKHIVSRMSSYFPNRWPLSYLNLTKI